MEATAAASAKGLQTIADLVPRAAAQYADQSAVRFKRDGAWHDLTYGSSRRSSRRSALA